MKVTSKRITSKSMGLALLAVILAWSLQSNNATAAPNLTVTTTASQIAVAFYVGAEPHYGAFFSHAGGYNQSYLGPGGYSITCGSSAGCINAWTWWPDISGGRNVLLLPKCGWLYPCPGYQVVVYDQWQPYNYRSTFPY